MPANLAHMLDGLHERSERLAAQVDALARALHAGGVPEETATRLLGHASAAVLQALTLEALVAAPAPAAPVVQEPPRKPSLPLAA